MQVYGYAEELASNRRLRPKQDLISVLIDAEVEGEKLDQLELDLFFLLLIVAGNETTRNLMSGAMTAFFDHPDQWEQLRQDRSLLPERGRGDAALRHSRHALPPHGHRGHGDARPADRGGRQDRLLAHLGQPRRVGLREPDTFDVTRSPNHHIAFGGGGPHFCLGANLARMEIMVMFDRLLDRDARHPARRRGPTAAVQLHQRHQAHPGRLRTLAPVGGTPLPARAR